MSLSVHNLTKSYGDQKALDDVTFKVEKGQILGLLGPNGAGKTTTMKILSGYLTDFEGEAEVEDYNVRRHPLELKKTIGYLPEHNPLYLDMFIREYLSFIGHIHKLDNLNDRISEIVHQTGLSPEQHKKIGELSKGYRQRVGLAQALIHNPEVLILDEPTTGLDPNQLIEIRQLIRHIGQSKTIIFSSHIMQEVQALCERVVILNQGKVVADERIEVLEQIIRKQRKVVIELNRPWEGKWQLGGIIEIENVGPNKYALLFDRKGVDPRLLTFDYVVSRGYKILELQEYRWSIEDVFQTLTAKN